MNVQAHPQLVKAKPDELPTIRELLKSCDLPGRDLTKAHLKHFFTAKLEGVIVGTVGLERYAGNGLLRSLAVRQNQRGKGLGKRLVRRIEFHAGDLGIDGVYLLTTTAASFFQHLGYEKMSRQRVPDPILQSEQFAEICPSSAVPMRKSI